MLNKGLQFNLMFVANWPRSEKFAKTIKMSTLACAGYICKLHTERQK